MTNLALHDWAADPMVDSAVVGHGFTPYLRDYDVLVDVPAAKPDNAGSYIRGRYRYRFTHCVEAQVQTRVAPDTWRRSWDDAFVTLTAWRQAGEPEGFVWGVEWADAYPGPSSEATSAAAIDWSRQLRRPMHGIRIETNAFALRLVCHDLRVTQLAAGDPATGELHPMPVD